MFSDFLLISKGNRDLSHKHNMVSYLVLCEFRCRKEANYEVVYHASVPTTIRMQIVVPAENSRSCNSISGSLIVQPLCQCPYCLTAFFPEFQVFVFPSTRTLTELYSIFWKLLKIQLFWNVFWSRLKWNHVCGSVID